eukprot:gene17205-20467_t
MERYQNIALLGSGSYGKVYKVRSKLDGAIYVLKKVSLPSNEAKDREAALKEAQVLSALRHPHIVPLIEYFWEEEEWTQDLCLVMPFCEGGDLTQYMKRRAAANDPIEPPEIWRWMVQLVLALQYLHTKRFLHRDLKSLNVFMLGNKLMLGDFGVARRLEKSFDMAQTQTGTLSYMSPEILEGKPYSYK